MAVNKRDLSTLTGETGWPVVNYAQEERNLQTTPDGRAGPLSIPRFKFTWLVEFQLNSRVLDNPITNLNDFVSNNGKLYTHLLSIDHPRPTFKNEKLRSYNKWINVPTQVEYQAATMTFHDDSTSVVQALWKEHLNFYTYQASIGDTISGGNSNSNLGSSQEVNSFQFTDELTATDGDEMRAAMGRRPSLGMRLKPNDARHFFESIVIYDLGTEPDAINVYWFHRPMITGWDHDNLDKEDRTGNVRVSATFDYEGYYFTIGQNRGRLGEYISQVLGAIPENVGSAPRKDGIARDGRQRPIGQPVESGSSSGTFPAEDALRAQNVLTGSGVPQGQGSGDLANASIPEQLASVGGLNSPASRIKQELEAAGIPDAQTFPLGTRPGPALTEPASSNELRPIIPLSEDGKQRDLDQTRVQRSNIFNTAESVGRGLTPDETHRVQQLDSRENVLVDALQNQQTFKRSRAVVSPAENSALNNTKNATGIGAPPINTTKIPNPVNQQKSDDLLSGSERAQQQANRYSQIVDEQRVISQNAADAGDNILAQQANEAATANALKANRSQAQADFLKEKSDDIDPALG